MEGGRANRCDLPRGGAAGCMTRPNNGDERQRKKKGNMASKQTQHTFGVTRNTLAMGTYDEAVRFVFFSFFCMFFGRPLIPFPLSPSPVSVSPFSRVIFFWPPPPPPPSDNPCSGLPRATCYSNCIVTAQTAAVAAAVSLPFSFPLFTSVARSCPNLGCCPWLSSDSPCLFCHPVLSFFFVSSSPWLLSLSMI